MRMIVLFCAGLALAADLPVREVVLYKNGIGYFRRAGEVKAGEPARLEFKAGEMNDVLKSLTVLDEGGGRVTGLRYDASEPLERTLAEFPFQVGRQQALAAFLDQLKGARVELLAGASTAAGTIVSGREVPGDKERPPREQLLLLMDSGELRAFDLGGVGGIKLSDPALQAKLKDYLARVAEARSKEKRALYIDSGGRKISAAYVIPTAVWKSSYRLIFPEAGEPTLEGWAIVDNTTGEDWNGVRLSLVSGRPVSFISKLYEPRYVQRQEAELPEERAAAPQVHMGGMAGAMKAEAMAAPAAPPASRRFALDVASTIAPPPEARELADLFEYRFSNPVTVRKSESAMLPFLQQKIGARKLLIFSDSGSPHPRNAAEISNSTEKTLDGGPITVYDANAYAGEALMETLKAGDKRLISYAEDLGARVATELGSTRDFIRELHVRRGIVTTRSAIQETKTYTIRNVDRKAKTLILEHPIRREYKLLKLTPSETTATAYRFEVKLAPGATEKFPVTEERLIENSIALINVTPDILLSWVENKAIDVKARQQLERVQKQKAQIAELDAEARRTEQQLNDLMKDEERVRENIASLNRVSGQQEQVQNYARQLAAQETQIAALRDHASELRKKKAALETELNGLIEALEF